MTRSREMFLNAVRAPAVGIAKSESMKTFLITILAITGITSFAPEAQAKDHGHRHRDSYRCEYPSYRHSYYRGGWEPRAYYGRSHYYSYSAPRYYRTERCYTERRHFVRPSLISFLFGF